MDSHKYIIIEATKWRVIRSAGVACVALSLSACESSSSEENDESRGTSELEVELQGLVDSEVAQQQILGMAMTVRSHEGTVIAAQSGFSDPEQDDAWSVDTQSALGSVTKTFTAVVIVQLFEEDRLSLDDTIDKWFDDQPGGDEITVRMLLSHTSGLGTYINGAEHQDEIWGGDFASAWTPQELVAKANESGPAGEPGSSIAHYANTNFILLGLITEELTGNSWAEEIEARILEPLDLEDTTFLSSEGALQTLVGGYAQTEDGYQNLLNQDWYPHSTSIWSAGEIVSTASDLLTFASALFDGELVSPESLTLMAEPLGIDAASGIVWGLGGGTIEGLPPGAFGMGGDIPGYHAFFMGIQGTKLAAATLINTEEGDAIGPTLAALEHVASLQSEAP